MSNWEKTCVALTALVAVALVVAVVAIKVSVWNECREGHSLLYCLAR